MSRIYLSLGSNIDARSNIRSAVAQLRQTFKVMAVSTVYESIAVGFKGVNFFNLAVLAHTDLSPKDVVTALRVIEDAHQRDRSAPRFSGRTLDIDLLLYDKMIIHGVDLELPRPDLFAHAFVLAPLAEIGGSEVCSPFTKTLRQFWEEFSGDKHVLWKVDFDLSASV